MASGLKRFKAPSRAKEDRKESSLTTKFYKIKAPVSGNIQQIVGKYVGTFSQMGESLGIISADSSILVECYVSTQDIG